MNWNARKRVREDSVQAHKGSVQKGGFEVLRLKGILACGILLIPGATFPYARMCVGFLFKLAVPTLREKHKFVIPFSL